MSISAINSDFIKLYILCYKTKYINIGNFSERNKEKIHDASRHELTRCGFTNSFMKRLCDVTNKKIIYNISEDTGFSFDKDTILKSSCDFFTIMLGNGVLDHIWTVIKFDDNYLLISSYVGKYIYITRHMTEIDFINQINNCFVFLENTKNEDLWEQITFVSEGTDCSGTIIEDYKYRLIIKGYNISEEFLKNQSNRIKNFLLSLTAKSLITLQNISNDENPNRSIIHFITEKYNDFNFYDKMISLTKEATSLGKS